MWNSVCICILLYNYVKHAHYNVQYFLDVVPITQRLHVTRTYATSTYVNVCISYIHVLSMFVLNYLPETGSKLIILFIRCVDRITSSNSATLPPDMLVLPAWGHTAKFLPLQYFNISDTSFVVFGFNTNPLSPAHAHASVKHDRNNDNGNNNPCYV